MDKQIIQHTDHREHPLPEGSWLMTQTWEDLFFLHWPVPEQLMRDLLPPGLELDTYEREAWISFIPFRACHVRLRNTPSVPYFHKYLEMNIRTYVKYNGVKGVYFFSLDANKWHTVLGARMATLPYFYAKMDFRKTGEQYRFTSERIGKENAFNGTYQICGEPYYPKTDSLDHWLSERYYLWTYKSGHLFQVGIHHKPWKLQQAEAHIHRQSMTPFLPDSIFMFPPKASYVHSKRSLLWLPTKVV